MASLTFALDNELKSELSKFIWLNLSELARQELRRRLERRERFKRFDEILKDSEMTDELAFEFADKLKRRVAKRHGL